MTEIMVFDILYKNGTERHYETVITEENYEDIKKVQDTIRDSFYNNNGGYVSIGNNSDYGVYVRLSEVAEIKFTVIESEED